MPDHWGSGRAIEAALTRAAPSTLLPALFAYVIELFQWFRVQHGLELFAGLLMQGLFLGPQAFTLGAGFFQDLAYLFGLLFLQVIQALRRVGLGLDRLQGEHQRRGKGKRF